MNKIFDFFMFEGRSNIFACDQTYNVDGVCSSLSLDLALHT